MKKKFFSAVLAVLIAFSGGFLSISYIQNGGDAAKGKVSTPASLSSIPEYSGLPFVEINNNNPEFSQLWETSRQEFSPLDSLGRVGVATACLQKGMMPTEERGSIGMIKPSGWHTARYDDIIPTKYLYNRCHLIGFQLTGENDNELNLITGTRYMNVEGMLEFENNVAEYLTESGNHVMYRVTPVYKGKNLVCSGVQMEAYSVEDNGNGICFNVYVYNVQPGIEIDYRTGESRIAEGQNTVKDNEISDETIKYVVNTNTNKFHKTSCPGVADIKTKNKLKTSDDREKLIDMGYEPCKRCNP